jgi:hypothetical protein
MKNITIAIKNGSLQLTDFQRAIIYLKQYQLRICPEKKYLDASSVEMFEVVLEPFWQYHWSSLAIIAAFF